MDLVIGTRTNPTAVDQLVAELSTIVLSDATLYVGYPILSTADFSVALDSILTCVEYGIVIFDLGSYEPDSDWEQIEARQAEFEIALKAKLIRHKELTKRRELAVPIKVLTYLPFTPHGVSTTDLFIVQHGKLKEALEELVRMDRAYIRPLNAAIQQVATINPHNKRLSVKSESSKGGKLKLIEREIANLDRWQKKRVG